MPDIKLGTSTFNDIKVLQLYDVNNNICNFYYDSYVGPSLRVPLTNLGLKQLKTNINISEKKQQTISLKIEVVQ